MFFFYYYYYAALEPKHYCRTTPYILGLIYPKMGHFLHLTALWFLWNVLLCLYLVGVMCQCVCKSVLEMCPSLGVTSPSACWPQSQPSDQATMTFTTVQRYRRWFMPPGSEFFWVDSTTPESPQWASDTDTMPSRRSQSVAGEDPHISRYPDFLQGTIVCLETIVIRATA